MEEILASIRRIISDDPNAPRPAQTEPEAQIAAPPDDDDDDVLDLAKVAQQAKAVEEAPPPDDVAFRDVNEAANAAVIEPVLEPVSEPISEPAMAQSVHQPEPRFEEPPVEERIISPNTDASVSHAFRSLANTILTNNARTLEDLVRDMMRPMLKTWLDDNLPALVERLVRVEIERVARGGR
jgi:cell pole-organizing protein PopZ